MIAIEPCRAAFYDYTFGLGSGSLRLTRYSLIHSFIPPFNPVEVRGNYASSSARFQMELHRLQLAFCS